MATELMQRDTISKEAQTAIAGSDQGPNRKAVIAEKYADETLRLIEAHGKEIAPLTPEGEKRIVKKLYLNVMGLLLAINLLLFVRFPILYYMPCPNSFTD